MNDRLPLDELEPGERDLHRVLASVPPVAPPFGFRESVMARLRGERRVTWEWAVAILFALPSLAFLVRQVMVHGQDFVNAIANIVAASSTETSDAFFFVDGLTVVALALFGVACAVAAHALFVTDTRAGGRGRSLA